MKIKKSAFLIIILCVAYTQTMAQEYAFKVLVNKGKNEVKSGNGWQPIKVGSSLKSADELKVSDNAYVGLVHTTGKPLELKQSGKYKVIDLAAKVSGGSSVLNKYTDFILSSNASPKSTLNATGAVHRGSDNIQVFLPPSNMAVIYNSEVTINWDTKNSSSPYFVTFTSMFGDELEKIETTDNFITINLEDKKFQNEDNILVKVISKNDANKESNDYTLKRVSQADKDRIKNQLSEIHQQTAEENALNKLLLAGFFEENNLFIDAITLYQQAIKLAPDVPAYKEAYNDFLLRTSIIQPPVKK